MLLAVPVALVAGFVAFASPCVLPLVPGYLGYLGGMSAATLGPRRVTAGAPAPAASGAAVSGTASSGPASSVAASSAAASSGTASSGTASSGTASSGTAPAPDRRRLLAGVGLFVAGFTLVFVLLGVLAGSLGGVLRDWQDPVSRVLGAVVVVMGLAFLGFVPFLQQERRAHLSPRAGLWGAPLLGVVFGLGWTPCIGPTLVAITALSLDGGSAGRGAVLSVAFCLGLGLPFLLLALGTARSRRAHELLRRHRLAVMRAGGGLLVLLGLALVTGVWGTWAQWLQGLVTGADVFVPVV
ncbi:cytochrome c biogenesis CcdA family protein [Cellulomonas sp. NS3]|uniref:cytochrome c biogenesis CcdA family protein n=1 Tax=Cellulomonas sp. NS3 TaxID=2973977 RepID=UPI002162C70B|nr:cytochrome c biogenesis CcdA family protein [Cellulomonas sp. NS3]